MTAAFHTRSAIGAIIRIAMATTLLAIPAVRAFAESAKPAHKTFTLTVENKRISIGDGISYDAWTYNGTVPGPVLRVRQDDEVTMRLINRTSMTHGLDTSAAEVAPNLNFDARDGHRNLSYTFRAMVPGVFLYQCSAIPMLSHVANGMYGMMIVDPRGGWPHKAHEVTIIQGEFYGSPDEKGLVEGDSRKEMEERPEFIVFNGEINRYLDHPIPIKVGELVRVFFVNAGPNLLSTFHVSGVIFSTVYRGGNPADPLHGLADFEVGPGDSAVFEFRVHQAGDYIFFDHALARPLKGAKGIFRATR
jgi:nitrite reductase (NO-forming)